MIFAFSHVFNMEFGGEFKNNSCRFDLSDERASQGRYFLDKIPQQRFVANHRTLGPIIVCIEKTLTSPSALVFHKEGILFETLPNDIRPTPDCDKQLEFLLKKLGSTSDFAYSGRRRSESDLSEMRRKLFETIKPSDLKFSELIHRIYDQVFPERYKVGLLRMPPGKSYEDELFKIDSVSPEFTKFLSLISDEGSTLNGRYLASHNNQQVLFHCGPYISLSSERFVSHDTVVIVFKEGGDDDVFVPSAKTSHRTQVYIVVAPITTPEGEQKYRVQLASKLRVDPFPPFLPENGIFAPGPAFKEFLLTKIVNGSRAGLRVTAPFIKTLEASLETVVGQYVR